VLHISYADNVFATDERVGDLVLHYATLLARSGSADTVTIPARIEDQGIEPVSVLVGPASQITAWRDDEPFDGDTEDAVTDLESRIRAVATGIAASGEPLPPGVIDEFDDLA
jgi:hypothetical protein